MKRSCVTQDWGLSLTLSLLPSGKKRRMIKGRAPARGGYDCCALALPTPTCIFNVGGGESRDYDCCALTLPTPSCTYNSGGGGSTTGSSSSGTTTTVVIKTVQDDQLGSQLSLPWPGTTWEEKVRLLNGTAPLRVLEKRLFSTDVSRDHSRFLFTKDDQEGKPPPQDQTKMRERGPRMLLDTLTEAEKEAARADGGLPLLLFDRWGNEHGGNKLKFWKSNHSYVILGKWPSFVRLGELESGDAVQVHVFRVPVQAAAATNAPSAAGPDPVPSEAAASGPPPDQGGRPCMLAVVICSQVAVEEEERRRRESPEDKEARRRLQNLDPAKPRSKKRTGEEGARGLIQVGRHSVSTMGAAR